MIGTPLNNAPCSDGNNCTANDYCFNGVCQSGEDTCVVKCKSFALD